MIDDKIASQILLGSMHGDGCIYIHKECVNPIYKESHCEAQTDYNIWKFVTLSSVFKLKHYYIRTKNGVVSSFSSSVDERLMDYRKLFYTKEGSNRKYITRECLDMLDPLGLAVFYQDDGSYDFGSKMITIAVCVHDKEVQEVMCKYFKEVWGLTMNVYKSGNDEFRSVFDVESSDKFLKIIEPYVHNCLRYKLGHLESSNKQRFIDARAKSTARQKAMRSTEVGKEQMVEYNAKYAGRIKDWNIDNKEHRQEYMGNYYEYNKDTIKERTKKWREDNNEKAKEYGKDYYQENKDKWVQDDDYYDRNKDRIKAANKRYEDKNKDKISARNASRRYKKLYGLDDCINKDVFREKVLEKYGSIDEFKREFPKCMLK